VLSGLRPIHVVRLLLLALNTLVIASTVTLIGLFERDCKVGYKFAQQWMLFNLWFSNVQVKVSGLENLDPKRQYIFMSNHRSAADIVAIGVALWAFQIRFVAKKELLRVPVFGWGLWAMRNIIIDRRNHVQAVRSYAVAGERIRRGISVVVFPEGTRGEGGDLLPFKKGGFVLAIETATPIAPIAVVNTETVMPKRSLRIESGVIEVRIGKPIETAGVAYKERDQLVEQVRDEIGALIRGERAAKPEREGRSQA